MNSESNKIKIKRKLLLFYLFLLIYSFPLKLSAQTIVFDTIYQSTNRIQGLDYSNECIYWLEVENGEIVVNRILNDVLESRKLPAGFSSCNYVNGFYAYGDFLYIRTINGPDQSGCKQGFLWGENSFILDTLDIGSICETYQNTILTQDEILIDINTGIKKTLTLENTQYRYSSSNICALNDSIANIKAFKYNKSNNAFVGQAIIQYNLNNDNLEEVFSSTNTLNITNESFLDKSIIFTESNGLNDVLYYYNGLELKQIIQRNITSVSADNYLNGIAFTTNDTLFYWEDGHLSILNDNAFKLVVDNCQLSWFSEFENNNMDFNIFNGTTHLKKPVVGGISFQPLILFDENRFLISPYSTFNDNEYFIMKGTHGLTCSDNCEDMDIQISNGDTQSYLKARKIESATVLEQGSVIYKAQESIHLLPGFNVANNAEFLAKLEECNSQSNLNRKENETENTLDLKEEYLNNPPEKGDVNKFARIEQNFPNPHRSSTLIEYYIPENSKTGKISIYNFVGLKVKEFNIDSFGTRGSIDIQMNHLAHGIYYYSLEVDLRIIDTKKMIFIK